MSAIICLVLATALTGTSIYSSIVNNNSNIEKLEKNLRDAFDKQAEFQVQNIVTMLSEINEKSKRGGVRLEEANTQLAEYWMDLIK